MTGIAAERQNVPECQLNVFKQLPRGMRKTFSDTSTEFSREAVHRGVKVRVRFVPVDCFRKLFTENFVVAHGLVDEQDRLLVAALNCFVCRSVV